VRIFSFVDASTAVGLGTDAGSGTNLLPTFTGNGTTDQFFSIPVNFPVKSGEKLFTTGSSLGVVIE
jgi:hypothetical protein